jgi:hypothetical protein
MRWFQGNLDIDEMRTRGEHHWIVTSQTGRRLGETRCVRGDVSDRPIHCEESGQEERAS